MCINVGSGFVCFCVIEYSRAAGQVMDFTPDYSIKRMQIRKEVHCAGGNNTKNDCPCNQDIQTDRKCSPEGDEDVSGASEE